MRFIWPTVAVAMSDRGSVQVFSVDISARSRNCAAEAGAVKMHVSVLTDEVCRMFCATESCATPDFASGFDERAQQVAGMRSTFAESVYRGLTLSRCNRLPRITNGAQTNLKQFGKISLCRLDSCCTQCSVAGSLALILGPEHQRRLRRESLRRACAYGPCKSRLLQLQAMPGIYLLPGARCSFCGLSHAMYFCSPRCKGCMQRCALFGTIADCLLMQSNYRALRVEKSSSRHIQYCIRFAQTGL
eukprot:SAG25_NODE_1464_length_2962_cov_81.648808_3_plen_245_part_00